MAEANESASKESDASSARRRPRLLLRLWRAVSRPSSAYSLGTLLGGGLVLGILLWGGFNWAMELTNTETFCISCHEMERNVFHEYRNTVHYDNRSGVRATCPDCHVPKEWIHKVIRKARATNELFHHMMGSIDTREKFEARRLALARFEWARMKRTDSRECRNCHSFDFMDFTKQENRSSKRHQEAIADGQTCIDCHKGIAHELPEGAYDEAEKLAASGG